MTVKEKNQVFDTITKNDMVYIKQNGNSGPVLVTDINIRQDKFPQIYNVFDENKEN